MYEIIDAASPNQSARPRGARVELVVIHGTAGRSEAGDLEWLRSERAGASYHYLIARDGRIWRLVPEHREAWHAGVSQWRGRPYVNAFSVGVGLCNAGPPEPYPESQLRAAAWLVADLLRRHGLGADRILGHVDVSAPRKTDPWHTFPWSQFLRMVLCP